MLLFIGQRATWCQLVLCSPTSPSRGYPNTHRVTDPRIRVASGKLMVLVQRLELILRGGIYPMCVFVLYEERRNEMIEIVMDFAMSVGSSSMAPRSRSRYLVIALVNWLVGGGTRRDTEGHRGRQTGTGQPSAVTSEVFTKSFGFSTSSGRSGLRSTCSAAETPGGCIASIQGAKMT